MRRTGSPPSRDDEPLPRQDEQTGQLVGDVRLGGHQVPGDDGVGVRCDDPDRLGEEPVDHRDPQPATVSA